MFLLDNRMTRRTLLAWGGVTQAAFLVGVAIIFATSVPNVKGTVVSKVPTWVVGQWARPVRGGAGCRRRAPSRTPSAAHCTTPLHFGGDCGRYTCTDHPVRSYLHGRAARADAGPARRGAHCWWCHRGCCTGLCCRPAHSSSSPPAHHMQVCPIEVRPAVFPINLLSFGAQVKRRRGAGGRAPQRDPREPPCERLLTPPAGPAAPGRLLRSPWPSPTPSPSSCVP